MNMYSYKTVAWGISSNNIIKCTVSTPTILLGHFYKIPIQVFMCKMVRKCFFLSPHPTHRSYCIFLDPNLKCVVLLRAGEWWGWGVMKQPSHYLPATSEKET